MADRSVVFFDLVGYSMRAGLLESVGRSAQALAPLHEEIAALIDQALELSGHTRTSTNLDTSGDGGFAVFEQADHAYAFATGLLARALKLNQRSGSWPYQLRIGIATGDYWRASTRSVDDAGQVIIRAARMEPKAPRNAILVDQATFHALRPEHQSCFSGNVLTLVVKHGEEIKVHAWIPNGRESPPTVADILAAIRKRVLHLDVAAKSDWVQRLCKDLSRRKLLPSDAHSAAQLAELFCTGDSAGSEDLLLAIGKAGRIDEANLALAAELTLAAALRCLDLQAIDLWRLDPNQKFARAGFINSTSHLIATAALAGWQGLGICLSDRAGSLPALRPPKEPSDYAQSVIRQIYTHILGRSAAEHESPNPYALEAQDLGRLRLELRKRHDDGVALAVVIDCRELSIETIQHTIEAVAKALNLTVLAYQPGLGKAPVRADTGYDVEEFHAQLCDLAKHYLSGT